MLRGRAGQSTCVCHSGVPSLVLLVLALRPGRSLWDISFHVCKMGTIPTLPNRGTVRVTERTCVKWSGKLGRSTNASPRLLPAACMKLAVVSGWANGG